MFPNCFSDKTIPSSVPLVLQRPGKTFHGLLSSTGNKGDYLPSGMATVNHQRSPRHKGTRVAEQENRCSSVLCGRRQPAQHVFLLPEFL